MIEFVARVSGFEFSRHAVERPKTASGFMAGLAEYEHENDAFRGELAAHLKEWPLDVRARIRDLALMIAGACGEAE